MFRTKWREEKNWKENRCCALEINILIYFFNAKTQIGVQKMLFICGNYVLLLILSSCHAMLGWTVEMMFWLGSTRPSARIPCKSNNYKLNALICTQLRNFNNFCHIYLISHILGKHFLCLSQRCTRAHIGTPERAWTHSDHIGSLIKPYSFCVMVSVFGIVYKTHTLSVKWKWSFFLSSESDLSFCDRLLMFMFSTAAVFWKLIPTWRASDVEYWCFNSSEYSMDLYQFQNNFHLGYHTLKSCARHAYIDPKQNKKQKKKTVVYKGFAFICIVRFTKRRLVGYWNTIKLRLESILKAIFKLNQVNFTRYTPILNTHKTTECTVKKEVLNWFGHCFSSSSSSGGSGGDATAADAKEMCDRRYKKRNNYFKRRIELAESCCGRWYSMHGNCFDREIADSLDRLSTQHNAYRTIIIPRHDRCFDERGASSSSIPWKVSNGNDYLDACVYAEPSELLVFVQFPSLEHIRCSLEVRNIKSTFLYRLLLLTAHCFM